MKRTTTRRSHTRANGSNVRQHEVKLTKKQAMQQRAMEILDNPFNLDSKAPAWQSPKGVEYHEAHAKGAKLWREEMYEDYNCRGAINSLNDGDLVDATNRALKKECDSNWWKAVKEGEIPFVEG